MEEMTIKKPGDDVMHIHFYNAWMYLHYFFNLCLFTPVGQICAAYISSPHTTHDSKNVRVGDASFSELVTEAERYSQI
jgi:hypothetical protein